MALSLLLTTFFLVLISPIAHSIRDIPNHENPSLYHSLKDIQGCHKGNSIKGINKLKHYLQQFGYLNYLNPTHVDNNDFDDDLDLALKTYQQNYHINPTGILDASTVSNMAAPRCGVPDIINGANTMSRKNRHSPPPSKSIHTVANFAFFPNNPRWPPSKTRLTYRFDSSAPTNIMAPVARAFQKWASATHFSFQQVGTNENSDLVIGFYSGDHGDGYPFDGRTIAHAFRPTDGRFHYDRDEPWADGAVPDALDLETVALHEIGHLLGLHHSQVVDAIMYPSIGRGVTKGLHQDDIQGIRALYNV